MHQFFPNYHRDTWLTPFASLGPQLSDKKKFGHNEVFLAKLHLLALSLKNHFFWRRRFFTKFDTTGQKMIQIRPKNSQNNPLNLSYPLVYERVQLNWYCAKNEHLFLPGNKIEGTCLCSNVAYAETKPQIKKQNYTECRPWKGLQNNILLNIWKKLFGPVQTRCLSKNRVFNDF